jgi:hypothetical protein
MVSVHRRLPAHGSAVTLLPPRSNKLGGASAPPWGVASAFTIPSRTPNDQRRGNYVGTVNPLEGRGCGPRGVPLAPHNPRSARLHSKVSRGIYAPLLRSSRPRRSRRRKYEDSAKPLLPRQRIDRRLHQLIRGNAANEESAAFPYILRFECNRASLAKHSVTRRNARQKY